MYKGPVVRRKEEQQRLKKASSIGVGEVCSKMKLEK